MTNKEKIQKCIEELEKHIAHCEMEAAHSLHNEICHISLKFDKRILAILKDDGKTKNSHNKKEKLNMKLINQIKDNHLKLEWYVLNHDFNSKKIYNFNILQQGYILDLIRMIEDKYHDVHDYKSLKECIKRWANYNFNHKTEFEIFVNGWFDNEDNLTKISVYDQIEPNLDLLTEYINYKLQLFEKK